MSARLVATMAVVVILAMWSVSTADIIRVPSEEPTIQEGIDAAAEGDTVLVAPDTYTGPLNRDLDFDGVNMLLLSEPGRPAAVIDCEGTGRGFHFSSGEDTTLVIEGFTITNASADTGAGALCKNGSSPKLVDCTFSGNTATTWGGGVACRASSPVMVGCVFDGNTVTGGAASYGGGVSCVGYADAKIRDCDFTGNTAAGFGGAMNFNNHSNPHITGCTFTTNVTTGGAGGGAVFSGGSSAPTFTDCAFTDNSGLQGGALYTQHSPVTMTRCTFVGNHVTNQGGAVRFLYANSNGTLTDCTFAGNTTGSQGGAIAFALDADAVVTGCTFVGNGAGYNAGTFFFNQASPTVENSIIAFGTDGGTAACGEGTETPSFTYCVVFGNAGGDELCGTVADTMNRDPLFCDIQGGDYTLCANSPCLAANNAWGEHVGAHDAGCGDCDSPVEPVTWGAIKAMLR